MYVALLAVMVNVRYATDKYPQHDVSVRGPGIPTGIKLTASSPMQTEVHTTSYYCL